MRTFLLSAAVAALLASSTPAMAQDTASVDKTYEAAKSAELESIKLQLAPREDARGMAEMTEAENALRRLRETKGTSERRKIADELDSAMVRLHLVADHANHWK